MLRAEHTAVKLLCKTKVNEFNVAFGIDEDIFRLEISIRNTFLLM